MHIFFFNGESLYVRPNNHYKVQRYRKEKYKKVKAYRKSAEKEPTVKRYLVVLDLKPLRS